MLHNSSVDILCTVACHPLVEFVVSIVGSEKLLHHDVYVNDHVITLT